MQRPATSQITSPSSRAQVPALRPPCPLDEPRRGVSTRYHVTATLLAARLEEDNAIHLRIADPFNPERTMLVCFPESARGAAGGQPAVLHRFRTARQSFIEDFLMPPFEGFALLSGAARLTLVDHDLSQTEGEDTARLCVMDFEALEHGS
jgi:hypothetical protein